jgi:hypothetical protein
MNMKNILKRLSFLIILILLSNTCSCGFILYPERRGQTTGRVDPGIAILDAILFLPGVIPGVVAFAVDFASGAIYLPDGEASNRRDEMPADTFMAGEALGARNITALEKILYRKTGNRVRLKPSDIMVLRVNDPEFIKRHFTVALNQDRGLFSWK